MAAATPKYEGVAAIYMTMPMAQQALPLLGTCNVNEKKISLKFPLSGVSFDLPEAPSEGGKDLEFKMNGPKGEMTLTIVYRADAGAFIGQGKQDGQTLLSFVFYKPDSNLAFLNQL